MKPQTKLWLGVALVFALMALAWTALFMAAARSDVQFIPVERTAP